MKKVIAYIVVIILISAVVAGILFLDHRDILILSLSVIASVLFFALFYWAITTIDE